MAMARFALSRKTIALPAISPRVLTQRHRSGKANRGQLIEVDLDSITSSSSSEGGDAVEVISRRIRGLEEILQSINVRQSAPDWLPFRPGQSFWVPPTNPKPHSKLIEALGKASSARQLELNGEESMSLSTRQGWPSSFFEDTYTVPMEMMDESNSNEDVED